MWTFVFFATDSLAAPARLREGRGMANAPTTQFRLGDAVPRDAVEDACAELGLRLSNVVPQTATHPAQAIYVTPDRRTLLHLLEDEAQGRAVVTRGEGAEQLTSSILRLLTARPGGQ